MNTDSPGTTRPAPLGVDDLEWTAAVDREALVRFLDATARERARLEAAIAEADRAAAARAEAAARAAQRQRVELGELTLAALDELARLERVHASALDSIARAAQAGAERIVAAGEREAERLRAAVDGSSTTIVEGPEPAVRGRERSGAG